MSEKVNRKAIVIIVAVVAVIAIVGGTFAWFVTNSSLSQRLNLSGISVSADVYFQTADESKVSADNYKDEDGLYKLSLNSGDVNYIGNLRVTVNHSGSKAAIRVRMNYEWTTADGAVAQYRVKIPYYFNSYWYDNRDNDYCVYYQNKDGSGKASFDSTELIKRFDSKNFDTAGFSDGISVRALIEVDAVQPNRYPQLWGIEKLPWE